MVLSGEEPISCRNVISLQQLSNKLYVYDYVCVNTVMFTCMVMDKS
ncbi:hypothetical protein SAMN06295960_1684 [Paenibacillus aquistagni]|uniref:Uncharacterized protein n=1 Tax=Paenibacillus aquistagni TaxID=1852522 RepID=A0A1X7JK72_9BACL|nr:hypothetical protein SAMN06295960_1684 [Paenibacillus aquistagni]